MEELKATGQVRVRTRTSVVFSGKTLINPASPTLGALEQLLNTLRDSSEGSGCWSPSLCILPSPGLERAAAPSAPPEFCSPEGDTLAVPEFFYDKRRLPALHHVLITSFS